MNDYMKDMEWIHKIEEILMKYSVSATATWKGIAEEIFNEVVKGYHKESNTLSKRLYKWKNRAKSKMCKYKDCCYIIRTLTNTEICKIIEVQNSCWLYNRFESMSDKAILSKKALDYMYKDSR